MTATLSASRPIRQLPVELANQIAAGEVVERPASVVKELVENSLDAGATRIEISLSHGGLQSIVIRDNGCGIPKEELPLAISRHATSKITTLEELENIHSLGFRGEALASIGSVSRMSLSSCVADSDEAWQIDCASDELSVNATAHPPGTSISVSDLFYNTPARRKFMRTEKTEFRHIDEVVRRMALSHFDVGFTFKHNERTVYQLAPAGTEAARNRRVAKLCGKAFMDSARQVDFSARGLSIKGWITGPDFSRSQNDLQHFYVNGRVIRDRLITHAIRQVYQEWIPPGRHAAYVLQFVIDPAAVDVNVHPTKHEVRFREARMVHDFIHRSLREGLHDAGQVVSEPSWQPSHYQQPSFTPAEIAEPRVNSGTSTTNPGRLVINNRYILLEHANGLKVVDARLARQSLMYKKLTTALLGEGINRRPLLIPRTFPVTDQQLALLESAEPLIRQLGFEMNGNGPQSLMLRQIPLLIAGADLQVVLESLFAQLAVKGDQPEAQWLEQTVLVIAEAAARTQNIDTSPQELDRLLNEIDSLDDSRLWRCLSEQDLHHLFQNN